MSSKRDRNAVGDSRAIRFQTRTNESYEYFSLVCLECGAQFQFGQRKDGETLFPKRLDEHGQLLPDRGWKVWRQEGAGWDVETQRHPKRTPFNSVA